jgi:hypothetical protein
VKKELPKEAPKPGKFRLAEAETKTEAKSKAPLAASPGPEAAAPAAKEGRVTWK